MKIIGEASRDEVILTASRDELANLMGYYSETHVRSKLGVGSEIKVNEMYRYLRDISCAHRDMVRAQKQIEAVASLMVLPASLVEVIDAVSENIK